MYPLPSLSRPESRASDVGSTTTEPDGQPETCVEIPSSPGQKDWNTSRRASIAQSFSNLSSKIRHKSIFGSRMSNALSVNLNLTLVTRRGTAFEPLTRFTSARPSPTVVFTGNAIFCYA